MKPTIALVGVLGVEETVVFCTQVVSSAKFSRPFREMLPLSMSVLGDADSRLFNQFS